jgi:hypothetical protein
MFPHNQRQQTACNACVDQHSDCRLASVYYHSLFKIDTGPEQVSLRGVQTVLEIPVAYDYLFSL